MKKLIFLLFTLLVLPAALFAGGSQEGAIADGTYYAEEKKFSENSGWKYTVTLEVKDGKIVDVEWNGVHKDGGTDKVTRSKSGEYGMVEKGGAIAPWFEQAAKAEAYLLKVQDPTDIKYSSDEGHTDAISGVTIHVVEFFSLAEEALSGKPQ